MKNWLFFIIILLAAILLAATNPEFSQHKDVILPRLYEQRAREDNVLVVVTGPVAHARLRYNDYVVFSTTSIGGKTVTIGAAGLVVSLLR